MADNSSSDPIRDTQAAFRQAGERAQANGNRISMKMLEQAERNTREVFAAMRQIAAAGSVTEVMQLQTAFVRDQGTRAAEQAKEIGDLIAEFGREAVTATRG